MTTLQFIADAQLQAAADGQPRRFRVDPAYSGGTVPGYTARQDAPIVIDLATLAPRSENVVANLDHKSDARVGHVDEIGNDGRRLTLAGVVSAATAAAAEFLASAAQGFPWGASIEAELPTLERVDRGKTVSVNGQSFTGPVYVARGARLTAIAFVSTGADPSARAFAAQRGMTMHQSFQDFVSTMLPGGTADMDSDQLAALHGNYQGRSEATMEDRLATAGMLQASYDADDMRIRRLERRLAHDERLAKLEASIPVAHTVHSSSRDLAANGDVLIAALCLAGGLSSPEQHFAERTLDAAERIGRGVGLQSLLMRAACEHGYQSHPGEYINVGNIRQVLTAAFSPDIRAAGWSTLAISNVLSNTANKFLLDGFAEMPSEWRTIAAVKNVSNFKEHTFVRLLDSLEFEEVGAAGEIKHGTLADATMTARASTFAKMLTVTRQDIINDDLGALTDIPRRLGRAAGQKFNSLFWTAFLASDSFWASGNGNVLTGAGTSLDSAGAGLTAAIKAFRAQKSTAADGTKLIGGRPSILLAPPAIEIAARRLLNSAGIVTGADATMGSGNPFQGLATLVVEDRLAAAEGGSDANWYLLRSPSFAPCMLVPALNGRVEPTVETADADFNVLGVSMRGYSDVGVARGEVLCGLRMDGTA